MSASYNLAPGRKNPLKRQGKYFDELFDVKYCNVFQECAKQKIGGRSYWFSIKSDLCHLPVTYITSSPRDSASIVFSSKSEINKLAQLGII